MAQQILPTNTFTTAKWIVSPTASDGTHTTIGAALTSASSGDTIFIRTGSYTEDLSLKAGVNLTAFGSDSSLNTTGNVIINGLCTLTAAGSVTISGIQLQTNSKAIVAVTGSAASIVNLNNCYINASNNQAITFSSSSASAAINLNNCWGTIGTTGIAFFAHSSAGTLTMKYCNFLNPGASTTAATASAGTLEFDYCYTEFPITTSSTNTSFVRNTHFNCGAINTTAFTVGGSGANTANASVYSAGSASALSVSQTITIVGCQMLSANTNAVTGSGTLTAYAGLSFSNSSTMNVTNQTASTTRPGITRSAHQPAFAALLSASTSNNVTGDGTLYTIICDSVIFDQGSNYNNSTGIFTAPVTGRYLFTFSVVEANLGASHTSTQIQLSTSARAWNIIPAVNPGAMRSSGNFSSYTGSCLVDMTASDTAKVQVSVSGSTKTVGIFGQATNPATSFTGYLVC